MLERSGKAKALVLAISVLGACASPKPASQTPGTPSAASPTLAKENAGAPGAAGSAGAAHVAEGPPITLLPASAARRQQLVAISITSIDQLLAKGASLVAKAAPLPVDPVGLREMLLQQAGLGPEVAANLDFSSPAGATVVAAGPAGKTGLVMAVAARGAAEAERVIAGLGKPIAKRGAVVMVDNGTGGRGWVFRAGNVVVLSDELEALARGAMLALEARHPAPDDVTAVIYPDAIAAANGTDVKTALAAFTELMRQTQASSPDLVGSERYMQVLGEMIGMIADIETVEAGLSADESRGLALRVRLRPRAGSTLAASARDVHPFRFDEALLGADTKAPAGVMASSLGPLTTKFMAIQRDALVAAEAKKEKGAAGALALYDAIWGSLGGQSSAIFSLLPAAPYFSADFSYSLKDAAAAAKAATALAKMDVASAQALVKAQMGAATMFDLSVKKESVGKLKAMRMNMKLSKRALAQSGADMQPLVKMFGGGGKGGAGPGLDAYMAVAGDRIVGSVGKNAKARLAALAAGKPAKAQGKAQDTLADAMNAAAGRDGFFFMDLAAVVSMAAALVPEPRAAMVAQAATKPIPLYGTSGGDGAGKAVSFDLTLPPSAFVGAGAIIQRMGAIGAGAGQ